MRLLSAIIVLGLCTATGFAQRAPDIARGTSEEEVIRLYGWPKGKSVTDNRESWLYDTFQVTFQAGEVETVAYVSPIPPGTVKSHPKSPVVVTRRLPEAAPKNSPTAPRPTFNITPAPAPLPTRPGASSATSRAVERGPAPIRREPNTPSMTGTFLRALWIPFAVVGLAFAIAVLRSRMSSMPSTPSDTDAPSGVQPPPRTVEESIARSLDAWRVAEAKRNSAVKSAEALKLKPKNVAAESAPRSVLTPDLLRQLEWKRFELIVARYFTSTGVRAECTSIGADGGIDVMLYRAGEGRPYSCVQCKAWGSKPVGVELVRALRGSMADSKIGAGVFVTTSDFTEAAVAFARNNEIETIATQDFVKRFGQLPEKTRGEILGEVTAGDFTTPTCPNCDIKMVWREKGGFWGCRNHPRCRRIINARAKAEN